MSVLIESYMKCYRFLSSFLYPKYTIDLDHSPRIVVNPQDIVGEFPETDIKWWNWKPYRETWEQIDKDPSTPIDELPLFPMMVQLYDRKNVGGYYVRKWLGRTLHLYKDIKDNGYDQDREKRVTIKIGPIGKMSLLNGHHRISMLQHLTHPPVKVDVKKRDPEWIKLKYDLFCLYEKKLLYQPIDHPDFDDWDVDRQCTDRLESILGFLVDVKEKRGLDIGSCTGWFSHRLVKNGAIMVGVDSDRRRISIAKRLSQCYNLLPNNPEFLSQRFEKYLKGKKDFDFILLLSLFHHYLRRNLNVAWEVVDLISNYTNIMFLDLPENPKDPLPIRWSPQLILEHSKFTRVDVLKGDTRPLYAFSR